MEVTNVRRSQMDSRALATGDRGAEEQGGEEEVVRFKEERLDQSETVVIM